LSSPELDLVVVGDCNPDVIIADADLAPTFGQRERLVETMSLVIGGSAAITAVAAARLGLRVALVAAVGDDAAGELMMALLRREGVDGGAVVVRPGLATGMTTVLSRGADRAILTAPGAISTLTRADVPVDLIRRARHLHVSSYFLLESSLGPGLAALFTSAREFGLTTSLDTNDDPAGLWGGRRLSRVIAAADVFAPNEAEALAICGAPDLAAAVRALSKVGTFIVVKLGSRGALCAASAADASAQPVLVSVPAMVPVDTTGAGDCFNAGLIAGLLHGLDLIAATALGCAVGALSTQGPGGTGAHVDLVAAAGLAERAALSRVVLPGKRALH
jgi:sugar/nucleoside kinase (ribokinase family)